MTAWSGWLPHTDLDIAMQLLSEQDREPLRQRLEQPGTLTLTTKIDTAGLFSPAVQPLSQLDYDQADDRWVRGRSVEFLANVPFELDVAASTSANVSVNSVRSSIETDHGEFGRSLVIPPQTSPIPMTLKMETGQSTSSFAVRSLWRVQCADGSIDSGPIALHRFKLPWSELELQTAPEGERPNEALASASWGRGRRIFMSPQAGCSKCHVAHGGGGQIGPDLSNLIHRDYASVLRDITHPSFAINPDYITYQGLLRDGRLLTGAIRNDAAQVIFADKDGKTTTIDRDEIRQLKPSTVSIMPDGIPKTLGQDSMQDLMAFLLTKAPTMPADSPLPPPQPRTRREVAAVLSGAPDKLPEDSSMTRPLQLLLVAGKKDHGPGEHDYPAWLRVWSELLRSAEGVTVADAMEWPTDEQIQSADTIIFFQKGSWTDQRAAAIDKHLAKGGGLVYIHWAVEGGPRAPEFAKRIGLASDAAKIRYRHGPLELGFESGRNHPIGATSTRFTFMTRVIGCC